eukprot:COSAG05_NODE_9375_length_628_cov_1.170132_1_plen_68_part_00
MHGYKWPINCTRTRMQTDRTHARDQHRSDGGAALLSLLGTEDQDNDEAGLFFVPADGTAVTAPRRVT